MTRYSRSGKLSANYTGMIKLLSFFVFSLFVLPLFSQGFSIPPIKPKDTLQMQVTFRVLPAELELFPDGETALLTAYGAGQSAISWESLNSNIARVDGNGLVTPVAEGQTIIKAFLPDKKVYTYCEVTVNQPNKWGNTNQALSQGGLMAVQNNWIYYANPYDGMKLYKIKMNGTGKSILSNDLPSMINVIGRWVYYIAEGNLYKVNIDGRDRTIVMPGFDTQYFRMLADGVAFMLKPDPELINDPKYTDVNKFVNRYVYQFSVKRPDLSHIKLPIKDPVTSILVDDQPRYIYYTKWWENYRQPGDRHGGVYKFNMQTGSNELMVPAHHVIKGIAIDDEEGWVYYAQDGSNSTPLRREWDWSELKFKEYTVNDPVGTGLFRTKSDYKKKTGIPTVDVTEGNWALAGKYIYYINECTVDEQCVFRRASVDGQEDFLLDILSGPKDAYRFYTFNDKLYVMKEGLLLKMDMNGRNKMELK